MLEQLMMSSDDASTMAMVQQMIRDPNALRALANASRAQRASAPADAPVASADASSDEEEAPPPSSGR